MTDFTNVTSPELGSRFDNLEKEIKPLLSKSSAMHRRWIALFIHDSDNPELKTLMATREQDADKINTLMTKMQELRDEVALRARVVLEGAASFQCSRGIL